MLTQRLEAPMPYGYQVYRNQRVKVEADLTCAVMMMLTIQPVSQATSYEVDVILGPVLLRSGCIFLPSIRDVTGAMERYSLLGNIHASIPCFPSFLHCCDLPLLCCPQVDGEMTL
jgi:hypothetical protein